MKLALYLLFLVNISQGAQSLEVPAQSVLRVGHGEFYYHASHSLRNINPKVQQAIITIHGSERNAGTYYRTIARLVRDKGVSKQTIVLAPHFKIAQDQLRLRELSFTGEGWLRGDQSLSADRHISSFEVMDQLIAVLGDIKRFPNLQNIIIMGHSAGGQFTQRYALASNSDQTSSHLKFHYIVANPGTYIYTSQYRPDPEQRGQFVIPQTQCDYNIYKWGLENPNPYLARRDVGAMVAVYTQKHITYLVGEDDTNTNIEQTCQAALQGRHRLERGQNMIAFMDFEHIGHRHQFVSAPGVGHSQYFLYLSPEGSQVIFP